MKGTTRLKDLSVHEGSLVDRGANKHALVKLHKSDDEPGLIQRITAAVLKALGKEVEPEPAENETGSTAVDEIPWEEFYKADDSAEEVLKGMFTEEVGDRKREAELSEVSGEIWDYCMAIERSITSILRSDKPNKAALIQGSVDQFAAAVEAATPSWLDGQKVQKAGRKISADRLKRLKDAHASLANIIQEAEGNEEGHEDMKIEKSVLAGLPAEVQAYIAEMEAKVEKADTEDKKDDINKADLPEAVRKRLEDLEAAVAKSAQEAEARVEAEYVAKARELGAVDPEKIGPVLKSLAETNKDGYEAMVATLKASSEAAKGTFEEIGKKGGTEPAGGAYGEVVAKAAEIRKSDTSLTQSQAIAKVLATDRDLAKRYTEERDAE